VEADTAAQSIETVPVFGATDKTGPYAVLVKWHPGCMSAPHTYVTDRLCFVISGTWCWPRHRLVDLSGCLTAFLTPKANPLRSGASAVHSQLTGFRLSLAG
jgi:hypothetical protein